MSPGKTTVNTTAYPCHCDIYTQEGKDTLNKYRVRLLTGQEIFMPHVPYSSVNTMTRDVYFQPVAPHFTEDMKKGNVREAERVGYWASKRRLINLEDILDSKDLLPKG